MGVIIVLYARIKNKRDTSSNFELNNPVLLNGEIVIVDDSSKGIRVKIGDGVNTYNDLPFFLDDVLSEIKNQINIIPIIASGMIMLWSGSADNIPDGWVLCDGNNGMPDLTDRFVIGAGKNYSVNNTGGEAEHILTTDELPAHSHTLSGDSIINSTTNGTVAIGVGGYFVTTNNFATLNTTESIGGGQAHNNMPPYYALCYIMKI